MTVKEAQRWLLARAAERGVELEVLSTSKHSLTIEAQNGEVSDVSMASSGGVGLRVISSGRVGYAYSEELSEEALSWTLDEAIGNAELQESGSATLPSGGKVGRHDLVEEGLSATLAEKKGTAEEFSRLLGADERVQAVQFARLREAQEEVEIASSVGVEGGYRSGNAILLAALVMRSGDSVKQGYQVDAQRAYHQLEPGRTAQRALHKIGRHLGARALKTGRRRAVLEPEVVGTLLSLLAYSLSGKMLAEGKSRLAGQLGERVASELVTVVDDATLVDGLASRPFDSEGTPSQRLVLVEDGVLRSFMHNSSTAARTAQANTGHASRGYRGSLDVAPTNLVLQAGSGIKPGAGVLVTDLMGVHAGANPITGDVSVQAMGLELHGDEQLPVDDFAISFNLFELLQRVVEVGSDFEWVVGAGGAVGAPSLAVDDLSFAGG